MGWLFLLPPRAVGSPGAFVFVGPGMFHVLSVFWIVFFCFAVFFAAFLLLALVSV